MINVTSTASFVNGSLLITLNDTVFLQTAISNESSFATFTYNLTNLHAGVFYLKVSFTSNTFENSSWSKKIIANKIPVTLKLLSYTENVNLGDKIKISLLLLDNTTGQPLNGQKVFLLIFWPSSGEAQISNVTNSKGIVTFYVSAIDEGTVPFSVDFLGTSIYSDAHLSSFIHVARGDYTGGSDDRTLDESLIIAGLAIISASSLPIIYMYRRVTSQIKRLFRPRRR